MHVIILTLLFSIYLVSGELYHEDYRPQLRYTPPKGWNNDPNGLLHYKDKYHLFFQYFPDAPHNGPQHWGHAVSTDLFHWENLPIALYPQLDGHEMIWSGSAIVDERNVTGFQPVGSANKTMVAIFTGMHDTDGTQSQWFAYSLDEGLNWKYYAGNPIIPNPGLRDFRDPKIFAFGDHYVIVLAAGDHVNLYSSQDMKHWELIQEWGHKAGSHAGTWECVDLWPIAATIDGKVVNKWVLTVNNNNRAQYFVGTFDGHKFTNDNPDSTTLYLEHGPEEYAGVTFNMLAPGDNLRRVYIAWMANFGYINEVPTSVWRGGMTLPREVTLTQVDKNLRLTSLPVREIHGLTRNTTKLSGSVLRANTTLDIVLKPKPTSHLLDIEVEFDVSGGDVGADTLGLEFAGKTDALKVYYTGVGTKYVIDRTRAGRHDFSKNFMLTPDGPRLTAGPVVSMRVVLDLSAVELYGDRGLTVMTGTFYSKDMLTDTIRVFYQSSKSGAQLKVNNLIINELNSIWK